MLYETQIEGNIIINKHTPKGQDYEPMMYVQGEIFWVDENNKDRTRPESVQVFLSLDGQVIQTVNVTPGTDGRWTYTMEPVPRYAALQGRTKLAGAVNSVGGSMKKAESTELQYSLRQGDVNGYKWVASLKSVEMDNHDVIATADLQTHLRMIPCRIYPER